MFGLTNLGTIHTAIGLVALAWGVFAAGILQLAFHLPSLARLGVLPRPRWGGCSPTSIRIR